MAVPPEWQGLGVPEAPLAAAESELRRGGCDRVSLDTTRHLGWAIRFYEAHGYHPSGAVGDFFGMELIGYIKPLGATGAGGAVGSLAAPGRRTSRFWFGFAWSS